MSKKDDGLITEPAPPKSLLAVLATLESLEEDFPPISDPPLATDNEAGQGPCG